MRPSPRSLVVIVVGLAVSSSAANAADPKNVKEAEKRFRQGVELMTMGRPDEARVQFAEANALVRSTDILWNLMGAEDRSAHYADALNHARQFVRDPKAPPDEVRDTNEKLIPAAARRVGQVEIEAPPGAQIEIDSKEKAGHAPLLDPYAVSPGPHQIVAIVATDRFTKEVDVAAGGTVHVALGPTIDPVAPPPETAAAPDPPLATSADPARGEGSARMATDRASDDGQGARIWTTAGFGAGVVLLTAASAAFFVAAQSSKDSATTVQSSLPAGACPGSARCAELENDLHAQNGEFHAGEGLLIGAGVAAVGAVVSWVFLRPRRSASSTATAFRLGPPSGAAHPALVLQGSF